MALGGAIQAGKAFIQLTIKKAEFDKKISEARASLSSLGEAADEAGKTILKSFALIQTPLVFAVKRFADFDDQMRLVKAVSGATSLQFEQLSDYAKELGMQASFTAKQISEGMASLSRMGFRVDEIYGGIKPMMDLARATGTSLSESSLIAANAMRAFGLTTADTERVCDILTATANGSAQSLHDLGEALIVAAPGAAQAGENISDVNAALGVMANMGFRGSIAGTALKRAYNQIARPDSQRMLAEFNVQTVDANGNLLRMVDILRDITKVIAGMGTAKRINFITRIFEERAAPMALAITKDTKNIDDFLEKMKDVRGEAARQAKEMNEGLGGEFRKATASIEGVSIAFGQALSPTLKEMTNRFIEYIKTVTIFINKNGSLVTKFAVVSAEALKFGAALFVASKALKALSLAVGLAKMVGDLMYKFKTLIVYLGYLSRHLTVARLKVIALSKATVAWSKISTAVKVGIILAAFYGAFKLIDSMIKARAKVLQGLADNAKKVYNYYADKNKENSEKRGDVVDPFVKLEKIANASKNARLTFMQVQAAVKLVNQLEPFGSKEWTKIDEVAGSVTLVADAFEKLNNNVKSQALRDAESELHYLNEHEKAVRNQMAKYNSFHRDWFNLGWDTSEEYNRQFEEQLEDITKRQLELYKEIATIKKSKIKKDVDVDSVVTDMEIEAGIKAENTEVSETQYEDAMNYLRDYDKKIKLNSYDSVTRSLLDVVDDLNQYQKNIDTMLQYWFNKEDSYQKEVEIDRLMQKYVDSTPIFEKIANDIKIKESEKAMKSINEYSADLYDKKERNTYEDLVNSNPRRAAAILPNIIKKIAKAVTNSFLQYKTEIENAAAPDSDGVVRFTDEEESMLKYLREELTDNRQYLAKLRDSLKEARERVANIKEDVKQYGSAYGSYSAREALANIYGSPEERTAQNTAKTAKLLEETNRIMRRQNGTVNMAYI